MDLQALKTELTTDPLAIRYAAMSDVAAADSLNAASSRDVNRTDVTGGEIAASIVLAEMGALTAGKQQYVAALMGCQSIPLTQNFKSELGNVFAGGSQSRANLVAILKRSGSRAEELGFGRVTPSDVADARRL